MFWGDALTAFIYLFIFNGASGTNVVFFGDGFSYELHKLQFDQFRITDQQKPVCPSVRVKTGPGSETTGHSFMVKTVQCVEENSGSGSNDDVIRRRMEVLLRNLSQSRKPFLDSTRFFVLVVIMSFCPSIIFIFNDADYKNSTVFHDYGTDDL